MSDNKNTPSEDTRAERFATLFKGLERAYGLTKYEGEATPGVKRKATSWTERKPLTRDHYRAHLNKGGGVIGGDTGLGVAMLDEDDQCWFFAVEPDIYDLAREELVQLFEAINRLNLPFVPCYSKSRGLHLYIHMLEPVPANLAQTKGQALRAMLAANLPNWPKAKLDKLRGMEVFPKQTQHTREEDGELSVGSWLNLPYWGGATDSPERVAIDLRAPGFPEITDLAAYLDYADSRRITRAQLEKVQLQLVRTEAGVRTLGVPCTRPAPRNGFDGPPCLNLVNAEKIDHNRNLFLYQFGIYDREKHKPDGRKTEDTVGHLQRLTEFNARAFAEPLPESEVRHISRMTLKDKYWWKCKEEPMASRCDKRACLSCPFGLGSGGGDAPTEIEVSEAFVERHAGKVLFQSDEERYYLHGDLVGRKATRPPRTPEERSNPEFFSVWHLDSVEETALQERLKRFLRQDLPELAFPEFARGMESLKATNTQRTLVRKDQRIDTRTRFDQHQNPNIIGLADGRVIEVDLLRKKWSVRPGAATDRVTLCLGVLYNPKAPAPRWLEYVKQTAVDRYGTPRPNVETFRRRVRALCLLGDNPEHIAVLNLGTSSRNGKGTENETVGLVMGQYHTVIPVHILTPDYNLQQKGALRSDLHAMDGMLHGVINELSKQESKLSVNNVKIWASQDGISYRPLYYRGGERILTKRPIAFISSNGLPDMEEDADAGLLERLLVVPWDRHFEEHEREKNLHLQMFEQEGAGILNWLLEGLTDYFANGLTPPVEVQQATNDARVQLSEMSKFAHDCIETVAEESAVIEVRPLFERWQSWQETRGRMQVHNGMRKMMPEPWTFDKFCKELRKLRKTTETTVDGKTRTIYRGGKLRGDWKTRLAARDGGEELGGSDDATW